MVLQGPPTRFGCIASQLKQYIDMLGPVTGPDNDAELETPELNALDHMAERCVEVARALKADRHES